MNGIKRTVAAVAVFSVLGAGCATMSEEDKAALGGLFGTVAGVAVAKALGADGWEAALIGLAAGYAGFQISKHLSENDQLAVREEAARALDGSNDGETVYWASEESGARASMTPRDSRRETREVEMLRDKRIETPPPLDLIGKPYVSAGSGVRLRSAPSTSADVVGSLNKGDAFHAIGKVQGQPWVMIGRSNIAMGYVHSDLVAEQDAIEEPQAASLRGGFELDEVDLAQINEQAQATFELDDLEVVGDSFVLNDVQCRTLDMEIVSDDGTETMSVNSCQGADGSWEAV